MKIQCDVCSKKEASVFCSADEAALCDACDHRVHHANKLASKHERFSLLHPSSSQFPLCDICQEKRAILFCQQDRAILCRDCELPLHTANEHTQKHNRFLLTGIKLSAILANHITKNIDECHTVPDMKTAKKPTPIPSEKTPNLASASLVTNCSNTVSANNNNQLNCGGSASNISDYLIDTLPGWHFEDLLVDSAYPAPMGFSKGGNNLDFEVNEDVLSFFDVEDENELPCFSTQSETFWVPQAAITSSNVIDQPFEYYPYTSGGLVHGTKQQQQQPPVTNMKFNRKFLSDDTFTVPQITSSVGSKRTRPIW